MRGEVGVINQGEEIKNLRQRVLQKEYNGHNGSKYERSKSDYSGKPFNTVYSKNPFQLFLICCISR